MSNNVCEFLKGVRDMSCNEKECIITFDNYEKVLSHNEFIQCFYHNVHPNATQKVNYNQNSTKKSKIGNDINHVKISKNDMTSHQRDVYEKRGGSGTHIKINRDHMTTHQRNKYDKSV